MDIRDIMDIVDIIDIMDIMITTAWMAMAGAILALVFSLIQQKPEWQFKMWVKCKKIYKY